MDIATTFPAGRSFPFINKRENVKTGMTAAQGVGDTTHLAKSLWKDLSSVFKESFQTPRSAQALQWLSSTVPSSMSSSLINQAKLSRSVQLKPLVGCSKKALPS